MFTIWLITAPQYDMLIMLLHIPLEDSNFLLPRALPLFTSLT